MYRLLNLTLSLGLALILGWLGWLFSSWIPSSPSITVTDIFITRFFIVAICVTVGGFLPYRRKWNGAITLVTTLGILGTFVGIFYGLLQFDEVDIAGSVPRLLGGLKIAFLTSIAGIAGSILLRGIDTILPRPEIATGATADTIANLLQTTQRIQEEANEQQLAALQQIERSLVGEGDATLLTQVQKMRTSLSDKQDDLIHEFRSFATTMAEQNSDALIEALREVIGDFNAKINEQFGDNFKQLNEAVGRLLEWQELYRQQMTEMIEQFQRGADGIETVKDMVEVITAEFQKTHQFVEKLQELMRELDRQRQLFEERIGSFAELSRKAQEAIPLLHERLNTLVTDITSTASQLVEHTKEAIHHGERAVQQQQQAIASQTERLSETIRRAHQETETCLQGVANSITELAQHNNKLIRDQVEDLEKRLEEALYRSINSLGTQLAALSEKFVGDYEPLTNKLRDVVRLAENSHRG